MSEASGIGTFVIAAIQVLTLVGLWLKLSGKEKRTISPQPFSVRPDLDPADRFAPLDHEHAALLPRDEHKTLCAGQIEGLRHAIKHATLDREAVQRQLDGMSNLIRTEFQEQERHNEERASVIHARINGISDPVNQLIGRFQTHVEEHRKGGPS